MYDILLSNNGSDANSNRFVFNSLLLTTTLD